MRRVLVKRSEFSLLSSPVESDVLEVLENGVHFSFSEFQRAVGVEVTSLEPGALAVLYLVGLFVSSEDGSWPRESTNRRVDGLDFVVAEA